LRTSASTDPRSIGEVFEVYKNQKKYIGLRSYVCVPPKGSLHGEEIWPFTAAQAAVYLGIPAEEAARRLDKAVESGALKAVDVAGVRFYYRDPVEAADVILGSVDVASLPREERGKPMRL